MIFVDTGAWFAMAVGNDPDHEAAMSWLRRNREPLITTDYVLAETGDGVKSLVVTFKETQFIPVSKTKDATPITELF